MVAVNAFEACKIGDIETIRNLPRLDQSHVDQNGASCLHYAARGGSLVVVEHLVRSLGFSVQARTKTGATALHDAAARGNTAVVKWLIESGGLGVNDQDEGGVTALHLAARYSHFLTVEWLLDEANADASIRSREGALPLHFAVVGGDMDCVNVLVDENPRLVNMQMNNGATPIYLASQTGNLDVLKYLVDHKGATKIKAYDAMSCLHAAAQKGHLSVVKWLVKEEKCNPNERDFDGATPLHFAASRGHADVVRWLLKEGGARVTLDNLGGSPLHSSAEHGELLCIQALLDCGCDVTYTDNEGLTAAELADHCDQTEAAALIRGEVTLAKLGINGFTSPEVNHGQNPPTQQHPPHPSHLIQEHITAQPHSTSPSAITTAAAAASSAARQHIPAPVPLTSGYRDYSPTTKHKEVVTTSGYGRGFVNHVPGNNSAEKSSITRTVSRVSVDSSASNFGVFEDRDAGVQHVVVAEIHKTPKVVPQTPRPVSSQRPLGHDSLNSTQESIVFSTSSSSFSQDEFPLDPDRRSSVQKTVNFFTDSLDKSETRHRQQTVHPSPPHISTSGSSQRVTSATSSASLLPNSPDSSFSSNADPGPHSQKQDSPKDVTKFQYYSTPYKKDFNTVTKTSFARAKALFQLNKVDGPEICPDSGEVCSKSEREHHQPNQRSSSSKMEAHEISEHGKNSGLSTKSNGSLTASSVSTQPAQSPAKSVITINGGHAMIINSTSGKADSKDQQHSTKPPQQQSRGGATAVQMQKDSMMKELQLKNRNSEHRNTVPSAPALVNGHVGSNHLPHKANPGSLNLAMNGGEANPAYKSENMRSFSRSSSESSTSSQILSPVESKHNLIADIQSVVSGASSLSLRRTFSKGEGVSMVYQSKKGAASQGEAKNDPVPLNGRFDPKNFMDKVEKVDSSGRAIPEWRRQVLARHLAEKTQNEFEDKKLTEDYEARFKDMPVWKRALIEKREAQARDTEVAGNKK